MIRAKKSLGQHFLTSVTAGKKMVSATEVSSDTIILEIGPGEGFLTEFLLESLSNDIRCIEKDDRIPEIFEQRFHDAIKTGRLRLIQQDFLTYELPREPYVVVANIPYYITGLIIRKLLEAEYQPQQITLLVQKEVAERMIAKDGKENLLSLSVKTFGAPRIVMNVGRRYFSPPPRVDSAIITITNISRDFFTENNINIQTFFELLHTAFNQKRKKLSNTLGISDTPYSNKRPEDLTIDEWREIALAYRP